MPFPNYHDIFSYVLCLPHFVTAKSGNLESEAPFLLSSHFAADRGPVCMISTTKPQKSLYPMGFFGFVVCTYILERFVKKPHRARSLRRRYLAFRSSLPRSTGRMRILHARGYFSVLFGCLTIKLLINDDTIPFGTIRLAVRGLNDYKLFCSLVASALKLLL